MYVKELKELLENVADDKKIIIGLDNADEVILKDIKIVIDDDIVYINLKTNINHPHIYKV